MELPEFKMYDRFFEKGDIASAFNSLKEIINSKYSSVIKAEALNLMGLCIQFDPNIDLEDESGISYFKRALSLDPSNLGAHLNIINIYGDSVNCHSDTASFWESVNYLKENNHKFSEIELEKIKTITI